MNHFTLDHPSQETASPAVRPSVKGRMFSFDSSTSGPLNSVNAPNRRISVSQRERVMSRPKVVVNARERIVSLRRSIADAVSYGPLKVVARDYGISPREVSTLRTQLGMPGVPIFLEIARRNPALRAQVIAMLSGEGEAASPEAINEIVRRT